MKLIRKVGATSEIWQVFVADSSSTTGAGLTGLTNASASLTAYYHRDTDTTATAISLVSMTVGTFTSSGFKEIDATNMPGWYQFCPPNAAIASGAKSCAFHLKGATNMAPLPIEVQLTSLDPDTAALTAAAIATGVWQDTTAGDFTVASSIGKSLYTSGAVPGAAGGLFIAGSNAATTISGLTTGALSCTTITASGAVAFQSTFAVTTSTSLAALSCTTLTASGAVAFQSTFAVTTSTSLAAISGSTLTLSGAVAFQSTLTVTGAVLFSSTFATTGTTTFNAFTVTNATTLSGAVSLGSTLGVTGTVTFNAFTVTNAWTVSGATTLTGAVTATNASNSIKGIAVTATGLDLVAAASTFSQALTDAVWDEPTAGHATAGTTGKALTSAASAGDPWSTALPGAYGAGTAGKIVGDNLNATVSGVPGAVQSALFADASLLAVDNLNTLANNYVSGSLVANVTGTVSGNATAAAVAALPTTTTVNAIKAKTDNLPASPAAVGDIPTAVQNADALIARNIAGGSSTGRTVKQALAVLRNKVSISGTTATVTDTDDTTALFTVALTTDATADPITAADPS